MTCRSRSLTVLDNVLTGALFRVRGPRLGPEQALRAAGATRLQVYAGAMVRQGMKALIGHSFYMLGTNIRAATILGLVGGGGVGYYLLNAGREPSAGHPFEISGICVSPRRAAWRVNLRRDRAHCGCAW
ncbi:hypothetical protein [Cryobacterium sp. Hb1]|uniref:hypothetical protein n=1 Tax=Cryobacterium sp. Hb1 TaxID=1259147 RepID=UPI001F54472D|nr:hypothetical protein [Cryobacterium sp. Hb1]